MSLPIDEKEVERMEELKTQEEEELAQLLAPRHNLPYLDMSRTSIDLDALKLVPENEAREAKIAVFQKGGKILQVAITSPNSEKTQNAIRSLEQKDFKINTFLVSENGLMRAWKRYSEAGEAGEVYSGMIDVSAEKVNNFIQKTKTIDDLKNLFTEIASVKGRKISEVIEIILAGAIAIDSSDIHIEPQEEQVRLRFRIDGVLHDIFNFDPKIYRLVLSRIKLISGLKLNVHDQAQDGRFSIDLQDSKIEIRTSLIPENYGESIVMRILNPKTISVNLEEMGIEEHLLEILLKEIERPNGMLLTTGPTGSGKTSTLYAFLKKVYSPDVKVVTLEDPIEYHLEGITQTQIEEDRGYTFANGLRSILRQDPDVIMLGEIRDLETAQVALNAALTGHLVLSTLHTNSAAGAIPRLIDLGVNPNVIAPAINVAMAQRLIRRLCVECKEQYQPEGEEKTIIETTLKTIPAKYNPPSTENITIWKAKGCSKCNNTGYKKRIGVYEAILINEKLEQVIMQSPSAHQIVEATKNQEMLNMQQDGVLKIMKGVTSFDEVNKSIGFI